MNYAIQQLRQICLYIYLIFKTLHKSDMSVYLLFENVAMH